MPRTSKPVIDWPAIRARYEAGESPHSIAKSMGGITKQGIYKRTKREGWGQIAPEREEVNSLVNAQWTGELAGCHAYTPERGARILTALRNGATYGIAAAAAGIGAQTLKSWRERSQGFSREVDIALGASALQNVGNIQSAADRGDWRAANRMLEINPVSKGDFATDTKGFCGISVTFNIQRATDQDIAAAHRIIEVQAEEVG